MTHKKKIVQSDNHKVEIDIKLAPLISELWKRNINTMNSCQEVRPGFAYIEFMGGMDAEIFLNIVSQEISEKSNSMYQRIIGMIDDCKNTWEYDTTAYDSSMYIEADETDENIVNVHHVGSPRFIFPVTITFPITDLNKILKLIKESPEDFEGICSKFYSSSSQDNETDLEDIADKMLKNHKVKDGQQN